MPEGVGARILPHLPATVHAWGLVRAAGGGEEACGDLVLTLPLGSGSTAFVVIDVAGHGFARSRLADALARVIATELRGGGSAAEALGCADLCLRTSAADLPYAVAFVAIANPASRVLAYASAGHDVAFTLSCDGQVRPLHQTAPMLGVPFQVRPCDALHALAPSETLVVVTDGVSDSRPSDTTDFFGADRTARVVARSLERGDNPAQSVFAAACAHAGDRQADDIGILIARILDGHAGVAGAGR